MDKFERQIADFIAAHGLLRPRGRVIVAVSGGADSVALLSVLDALGYDVVAAHCNFHLRGAESVRDMRSVEALTAAMGVDLYVKDFDVPARCAATGESVEMACRELRYEWFGELLDRDYGQAIAVGHHREDRVETFFLNLLRGTGAAGLAAMRPRRDVVVRPLLETTRAQIEDYLRRKGLGWVDDSSNTSDQYLRNRLRNRLLPLMRELFDGADEAVLRTADNLREMHDFYAKAATEAAEAFHNADDEYDLEAMARHPFGRLLLFEALRGEGFSRRQTDDMMVAAANSGGSFGAGCSHVREVDHGMLRAPHAATAHMAGEVEVTLRHDVFEPVHIKVSHHNVIEFAPERNKNVIYLDSRANDPSHRWTLRPWRHGDRMRPFGMTGTKLVSDIFAQAKLSAEAKRQAKLLCCDGRVVWVAGLRASAEFAVGPDTKRYIRLELTD